MSVIRAVGCLCMLAAGSQGILGCATQPVAEAKQRYTSSDAGYTYPDGGADWLEAACNGITTSSAADAELTLCSDANLDPCAASECLHDVELCKAAKLLDYARSFATPIGYADRKQVLTEAAQRLEDAVVGPVEDQLDRVGSIVYQLRKGYPGSELDPASFKDNCSAVPAEALRRYYSKLASAVATLSEVTEELIEMDLAEADQSVGLYQSYSNARTREWETGVHLIANGSRSSALNRLLGVDVQDVIYGGGLSQPPSRVPVPVTILAPCTVDPSEPEVARALTMRKRFDYGLPPVDGGTGDAPDPFVVAANEVFADGGVWTATDAGSVRKSYTSADQIFEEYRVSRASFAASATYLEQEGTVFYRDGREVSSSVPRKSILAPPVSYLTLQQRRLKAASLALTDIPYPNKGLYYRLAQVQRLMATLNPIGDGSGRPSLDATRAEISGKIGDRQALWWSQVSATNMCADAGMRQLIVIVPATPAETPTLRIFYGERNAACASLGRYQGEACEPDYMPGDNMAGGFEDGTWDFGFGAIPVAYYGMCQNLHLGEPSLFAQELDDPYLAVQLNGRFLLVDAADLRPVGHDPADALEVAWFSPIGGTLQEMALRISERNPRNCGESKYNSLGLSRGLVPPLENELIDTGKPYENSFAYYLNLADQAATEAFRLTDEARRTENEIRSNSRKVQDETRNLAAEAADQIGQICGADADPAVGCRATMEEFYFSDLRLLPVGNPIGTSPPQPAPSAKLTDVDAFVAQLRAFVQDQQKRTVSALNATRITLPREFDDGRLDDSERARYGGEYLVTFLDVEEQLHLLKRVTIGMEGSMAVFDERLEEMRLHLAQMDDYELIFALNVTAAVAKFVASSSSWWDEISSFGGAGVGATMTLAADLATAEINREHSEQALGESVSKFKGDAISFITGLRQQSEDIRAAFTKIAQAQARLENLELKQRQIMGAEARHVESALFLADANNPFKRATYSREAERARDAIRRSKKLSFIARRAIEFKLVKNLLKEVGTEPFVASPKGWVDSIFAATQAGDPLKTDTWANSTVGYVQKLRDYVTAYPFVYPFQDGEDWAVISLRDDYLRPQDCLDSEVLPGRNLLRFSEEFEMWRVLNAQVQGLHSATDITDPLSPLAPLESHRASSFVHYGPSNRLESATVRLPDAIGEDPVTSVVVSVWLRADQASTAYLGVAQPGWQFSAFQQVAVGTEWERRSLVVEVPPAVRDVFVYLYVPVPGGPSPLYLFGAQVEVGSTLHDYQPTLAAAPSVFDESKCDPDSRITNAYGVPMGGSALGSTRSQLLRDAFNVKCRNSDVTSPAGTTCASAGGIEYYELPFSFSIADMEAGKVIKDFQIAAGNYNYRVQNLGVNFVGSNVKDCELDDANREACYANMFLPYSLSQDGHVQLRDYNQQVLEFGMPSGRISSAKGIAAERYLTIPLSSVDQAAITPYLKREFRGRPLEGSYILRVHNVPSLAWDNLEDIQLLIHYRYWTAFGS